MDNEKKNLIVEYALANKENLLLFSQIAKAFDDVIEKLVKSFSEELENELTLILGNDWIIHNDIKNDVFGKTGFSISKKKWNEFYSIGFYAENRGLRNFDFYVWRDIDIIKSPNKLINQLINENYKKGNVYKKGDWWQYIDEPYRNWTDEKAIIKLYEQSEMVKYFKEQFLKLKDIVEPIIDKELSKN
ncbi:hypothetical protein [Clostridium cochlearium]|uniref:Uncharacterized protein n=1 Tax=Clostridium cochlearium TaxID=1494 RepID=A0A7Y4DEX7_CLOCO|nr:hypothetical protein [Clostridium cochlearium]NOH17265.1 hypothetical protein [Clostridium cochlearium]